MIAAVGHLLIDGKTEYTLPAPEGIFVALFGVVLTAVCVNAKAAGIDGQSSGGGVYGVREVVAVEEAAVDDRLAAVDHDRRVGDIVKLGGRHAFLLISVEASALKVAAVDHGCAAVDGYGRAVHLDMLLAAGGVFVDPLHIFGGILARSDGELSAVDMKDVAVVDAVAVLQHNAVVINMTHIAVR